MLLASATAANGVRVDAVDMENGHVYEDAVCVELPVSSELAGPTRPLCLSLDWSDRLFTSNSG